MHKALLIAESIEVDGTFGSVISSEGFFEPRYLPDARMDLTDKNGKVLSD
jgi:hypothetical protein